MPVSPAPMLQTLPEEAALGVVSVQTCGAAGPRALPLSASSTAPLPGQPASVTCSPEHHSAQKIAFSKDWLVLFRAVIFHVEVKVT